MHKLPDDILITPTLLQRFETEAALEGGDGRFWACLIRSNGDIVEHVDRGPAPLAEQRLFAHDMVTVLNNQLHHDGAWVITFNQWQKPEPKVAPCYTRVTLMWMDQDGDVRFSIEDDRPPWEFLCDGMQEWLMKCESAWCAWLASVAALELKADQTYKAAQGEIAPSVRDPRILH